MPTQSSRKLCRVRIDLNPGPQRGVEKKFGNGTLAERQRHMVLDRNTVLELS